MPIDDEQFPARTPDLTGLSLAALSEAPPVLQATIAHFHAELRGDALPTSAFNAIAG
jgi:hypothetical protein